jgi:O-antigen/teichoic acid export membrane protein
MQENQSSYRSIMKATSLFGGVQVFNIIIAIIKSKIIAVLLGPAGLGVMGLLNSTLGLVSSLTNFGLGTSAVRDIAAANECGNQNRINKVVTVFRRLVWITGLLGSVFTFILSPWLSLLTFGNKEYTVAFMWLSCSLLFNQLASGQKVMLQGMRKLKYLAKANMLGSFIGLVISAPLYYYYRLDGIVPAIILTAIFLLGISWYFGRKIKIEQIIVTPKETVFEGKGMLKMGFMLSLSGLISMGASYIVRVFISNTGSLEDVGLYSAGFAIIGTYVGLVFTAMGADYYPRLSGVAHNNKKGNLVINQQAEIALLILAPILAIFLIFINWIVILLYSTKFIPINEMILWAATGMYFKAVSWSIAFILLAKGASKLFFWNELIVNIYMLGFNLLGYHLYGLNGLGISFLIAYVLYFFQVFLLAKYKYEFNFNTQFYKIFGIQLTIGIICFTITMFIATPFAYFLGLPFILISIWYSFKELDKRIDIKNLIESYKK